MWNMTVRAIDLPLAERFAISSASWDGARNVFAVIEHQGEWGVGEASPDSRSGESVDSVIAQLSEVELARLGGPFDLEGVLDLLPAGSARCVLDVALHDLAAKLLGGSLSDLLGVAGRPRPPTSITIPIAEPAKMVQRAAALAKHPVIKTKVGFRGDVEAVARIREVYPGTIRVDANEGWTVEEAAERLHRLEPFDIELCEQPISAGDPDGLRKVTEGTSIPVFADEDVCTSRDVAALAGAVDGVNLKLRKTGGIREATKAIAVARAMGMGVMLGCDLESGVAATAEAHLAAAVDHADIDGPLLLARDPYPGVAYLNGRMELPQGPGLGLKARPW
jgi:L-Ala-D/L-Glu epimerase